MKSSPTSSMRKRRFASIRPGLSLAVPRRAVTGLLVVMALSLSWEASAVGRPMFPLGPDPHLTPGDLCQRADERRYPERISYCRRDVATRLKRAIVEMYDRELGFHVAEMNRGDFKIDHFIPLCAGGSNAAENLWPQHKSVYEITDPLEPLVCEKMAQGRLSQSDAIELIRTGKHDLSRVPEILDHLHSL